MYRELTTSVVIMIVVPMMAASGTQKDTERGDPCGQAPWAEHAPQKVEDYFTSSEWDPIRAEDIPRMSPDTTAVRVEESRVCAKLMKPLREWMRNNLEREKQGGGPPPWSPKLHEWAVFRFGPYYAVEIAFKTPDEGVTFGRSLFFVLGGEDHEILDGPIL